MVENGTQIILRTEDAVFSPCKVMSISEKNVTVTFCKSVEWDNGVQKMVPTWHTETIDRNKIVSMTERS